ncbi:lysozyme [Azotobacter beijerinckii]|uniref:Lysozyme n=1 Tax=Azotobacter beijerinckii TaxID=170623 RepID=A0A1H7B5N2_9GAMM|nr:lysozyme [Azotobacter beijerinckii]SEI83560.1 lysozyme [Azotobacter beijerinckii]SEJ71567.1 lysozyme [Azotobacter beijerinckii]
MTMQRRLAIAAAGATLSIASVVVANFEGLRTKAYRDPVGIPTICYGHTATARIGQTRSQAECDALLRGDLGDALEQVDRLVTVPLPVERRAALASFAYNVGSGRLSGSTLLRKLNAGDTAGACAELSRWVYAGEEKLSGLVQRRAAERELCEVGL